MGIGLWKAYDLSQSPPLPILEESPWWGPGKRGQDDPSIRPFTIDIPIEVSLICLSWFLFYFYLKKMARRTITSNVKKLKIRNKNRAIANRWRKSARENETAQQQFSAITTPEQLEIIEHGSSGGQDTNLNFVNFCYYNFLYNTNVQCNTCF